jgi:V8-like Glu-specific endopeptidase
MSKKRTPEQTETIVRKSDGPKAVTDTSKPPYSAICALGIEWGDGRSSLGTGYIFGHATVFTVGHNLYDRDRRVLAQRITITPGISGGRYPFGSVTAERSALRPHPLWERSSDLKVADFNDLGAILLPSPLGSRTGWSDLAPATDQELAPGQEYYLLGYRADQVVGGAVPLMMSKGKILEHDGSFVAHDAPGSEGQSGGPMWSVRDFFPYVCVRGFHKGNATVGSANFAVMLNWGHYNWVQARMREAEHVPFADWDAKGTSEAEMPAEAAGKRGQTTEGVGPLEKPAGATSLYPEGVAHGGRTSENHVEGGTRAHGKGDQDIESTSPSRLVSSVTKTFKVPAGGKHVETLVLTARAKVSFTVYASLVDGGFSEFKFVVQDDEGGKLDDVTMAVSASGEDEFDREALDFEAPADGTYRLLFRAMNGADDGSAVNVKVKIERKGR